TKLIASNLNSFEYFFLVFIIHSSFENYLLTRMSGSIRPLQAWKVIAELLGVKSVPLPDIDICDKAADTAIRFIMFRLAVHYWEARWLLASKKLGDIIEKDKGKKGLKTIAPRWKRRMMLTPCIVSTFHALPNLMVATAFNEGSFYDEPMFNFVDLLIVDEAGQVSPDVAGASFALAKKALVIGDIHQIEPIQSITGPIDIGNLFSSNIIKNREEYESILDSGRSVVNGSVMRIAQKASQYHYKAEMESGMFLREHRRCYDEIISFCNELCYKGILLPKRGTSSESTKYPPFGYLHVDGLCSQNSGGSRYNELEAETIASWLHENRSQLESEYGSSVEDSIGIVTPFSAQVSLIQNACEKYGFKAAKKKRGITIGTVHALQGAERDLVIFSPVYSRHNDGGFIDSSSSMLNVAVSRAKNSFMVFGDMDVISASPKSQPRGVLAKYLFTDQTNEIVFSLKQRSDLLDKGMAPRLINNSEEHDAYIVELLKQAVDSVSIVSPWIQLEKLKDT
uniref:AAA domain-containing protein n=1 Tax=Paraglaciecola sp. TaxID=1920173 RepID=UPI0030F494C3